MSISLFFLLLRFVQVVDNYYDCDVTLSTNFFITSLSLSSRSGNSKASLLFYFFRERKKGKTYFSSLYFFSVWVSTSLLSLSFYYSSGGIFFSLPIPLAVRCNYWWEREEKRKEMCFCSVAPAAVAAVWTWCPWWQTTTLSYTATFAFSVHVRDCMYIAY